MTLRYETVFLDRDGVVNRKRIDYVRCWEEFEILPGTLDAIATLTRSGRRLIVLTNQSAIARDLVSAEAVDDIHLRFAAIAHDHGGHIDAFLVCPHQLSDACGCRKPSPGLFFRAATERNIDLGNAIMIGDQPSDIQAAHAAGCAAILISSNPAPELARNLGCMVAANLMEAARVVCGS